MKYRHSFHAGNFADVHKHVTLLALLRAMQHKDKGFLYLDAFAGAGRYDLSSAESHHGAEARHGIVPFVAAGAALQAPELRDYLSCIAALRENTGAHTHPGSPLLAAHILRAQDRGVCFEIVPPECRALERALGGYRRMQVECADGLKSLSARLPPRERRALILIDPPYEEPTDELDSALQAVSQIRERLANAVIVIWYPIKDERVLVPWLAQATQNIGAPTLSAELWIYPRDSRVGLNGSGMLIVNPPYQFEERQGVWLPELAEILDLSHRGGSAQRWLIAAQSQPT